MKIEISLRVGNGMEMEKLQHWLDVTSTMLQCSGISTAEPEIFIEHNIEDILFKNGGTAVERSELVDSFLDVNQVEFSKLPVENMGEDNEGRRLFWECCYIWQKNSTTSDLCLGYALRNNQWYPHIWLIKNDTVCEFSKYEFDKYCGQTFKGYNASKVSNFILGRK